MANKKAPRQDDDAQFERDSRALRIFDFHIPSWDPKTPSKSDDGRPIVHLNVYGVPEVNRYLYFTGIGLYSTGVVIDGTEWSYGGSGELGSGIYSYPPGKLGCSNDRMSSFEFKQTITLGPSSFTSKEVAEKILKMKASANWKGRDFDLKRKNSNNFCDSLCVELCGPHEMPPWINRLATMNIPYFLCIIMPDDVFCPPRP